MLPPTCTSRSSSSSISSLVNFSSRSASNSGCSGTHPISVSCNPNTCNETCCPTDKPSRSMLSPAIRMSVMGGPASLPITVSSVRSQAPEVLLGEELALLSVMESLSTCFTLRPSTIISALGGGAPSVRIIHSRGWLGLSMYSWSVMTCGRCFRYSSCQ